MGRVSAPSLLNRLLQSAVAVAVAATTRTVQKHRTPKSQTLTGSILFHLKSGNVHKAVALLGQYDLSSPLPDSTYASLFRLCSSKRAILEARRVHYHLTIFNPSPPTFLLNRAIETYAKCGCLEDARKLFEEMHHRDGGTWNATIVAYSQMGRPEEALSLFSRMNWSGVRANHITFASVLGSCADLLALSLVTQVHGVLVKFGLYCNVILGCSLVDSYGKCKLIDETQRAFDDISSPNSVSWNVILRRYLELGRSEQVVSMFFQMIREDVGPLNFTVYYALKACADRLALEEGWQIHGFVVKIGFDKDNVVGTSLTEIYAKCGVFDDALHFFYQHDSRDVFTWTSIISLCIMNGRMHEAETLFLEMPERNVVSWNAMLSGYVRCLSWEKALEFILWMQRETDDIDHITLSLILNVCAGLFDLEKGKQVHGFAYRHGLFCIHAVANAILDMYGKCGSLRAAETWFLQIGSHRDRISWNTLIRSFACHRRSELALAAFRKMQWEVTPDQFTFSTALAGCANMFALDHGKQIHGYMITNGYGQDTVLSAALVDMYSKCRSLEYAAKVFEVQDSRDIILWNSMIMGCSYNGYGRDALDLFAEMEKEGVGADNITFFGLLLGCISEGFVELGMKYFSLMSEKYGVIPLVKHYNSVIDLLGKYGHMEELQCFIRAMPFDPTIPMWTRIFDYCREHGDSRLGEEAARCINESNPQNPVRFEIIQDSTLSATQSVQHR